MAYKELKGNIFNTNAMAIVNTVNCVGAMGKGIALEFKLRFPEMFAEYQQICFAKQLQPGQIWPYRKSTPWILNFAIKDDWHDPSKVEWVEASLQKFAENYKRLGITSVAFPWMGAMNGGLPIETIKTLTRKYLQNLPDIDIEVYEFDTTCPEPLFNQLLKLAGPHTTPDYEKLAEQSHIQKRYWQKITETLQTTQIQSLYQLTTHKTNGKRIIGKTNIERLYRFLSNSK